MRFSRSADALDLEDRPQGRGRRAVEDLVLGVVDRLVEVLDRRQVGGDEQVEQVVKDVVGAVAAAVDRVALDVLPVLVDLGDRRGVIGDQVVPAEEDVELVEPELVGLGVEVDRVEDQVEVFAPVVHPGDVGLLQRVLDRQRVEVEDVAEQRLDLALGGRLAVLDIDPGRPGAVLDRLGDPLDGPVVVDRPRGIAVDRRGSTGPARDGAIGVGVRSERCGSSGRLRDRPGRSVLVFRGFSFSWRSASVRRSIVSVVAAPRGCRGGSGCPGNRNSSRPPGSGSAH